MRLTRLRCDCLNSHEGRSYEGGLVVRYRVGLLVGVICNVRGSILTVLSSTRIAHQLAMQNAHHTRTLPYLPVATLGVRYRSLNIYDAPVVFRIVRHTNRPDAGFPTRRNGPKRAITPARFLPGISYLAGVMILA